MEASMKGSNIWEESVALGTQLGVQPSARHANPALYDNPDLK